jgi:hypothetical protein
LPATNGHATAVPLNSVINSRLFIDDLVDASDERWQHGKANDLGGSRPTKTPREILNRLHGLANGCGAPLAPALLAKH